MPCGAHDSRPKQVSKKENRDPHHASDCFNKVLLHMQLENPFIQQMWGFRPSKGTIQSSLKTHCVKKSYKGFKADSQVCKI